MKKIFITTLTGLIATNTLAAPNGETPEKVREINNRLNDQRIQTENTVISLPQCLLNRLLIMIATWRMFKIRSPKGNSLFI